MEKYNCMIRNCKNESKYYVDSRQQIGIIKICEEHRKIFNEDKIKELEKK